MEMLNWLEKELSTCKFKDKRLEKRFKQLMTSINSNQRKSLPQACGSWSEAKATYRFLSNERVDESEILSGHFLNTAKRIQATKGPVLVLHDTTEFTYHREDPDRIGLIQKTPHIGKNAGPNKEYKVCGILMHASLAVTSEGLPLGLTSTRFWSRKVFKNTNQMKRKVNQTRLPIEGKESIKWLKNMEASVALAGTNPSKMIHIGDRENDIYEYYCRCRELDTFFISRVCVNRLANESTLVQEVGTQKCYAKQTIEFIDKKGNLISTTLDIRVKTVELHPPIGKEAHYPDIEVTFISAIEADVPENREPIRWSFITNLPVKSKKDIKQVLDWYKQRWKIETYFKVLKSGLKVEESKLRTADRLSRLISMCCILAWRIHWLTFLNRETEKINPEVAFDEIEIIIIKSTFSSYSLKTLQDFVTRLAVLGGYLNRKNDPPPGNIIIWRGLNRLHELKRGFLLANTCG